MNGANPSKKDNKLTILALTQFLQASLSEIDIGEKKCFFRWKIRVFMRFGQEILKDRKDIKNELIMVFHSYGIIYSMYISHQSSSSSLKRKQYHYFSTPHSGE